MEQYRGIESFGERIVKAARLAVAMHLGQTLEPDGQLERLLAGNFLDENHLDERSFRQRVEIGRADPRVVETIHHADLVMDD